MLLFRNEPAAGGGANLLKAISDRQLWAGSEMAAHWVGHGHLEEKLASTVQASDVRHHSPRPASGALRKGICFH